MAEMTVFAYRAQPSFLHRLDVRFKLLFLITLSLASLWTGLAGLGVLTLAWFLVFLGAPFPLKAAFKELKPFFVLAVFVFAARAVTAPGPPVLTLWSISVTRTGLHEGLVVAWRLTVVVFFGLFLISSTRANDIKAAVEWFLTPFGFLPGKRAAVMVGLVIRFIPLIFEQAGETAAAQKARGVELRKNPVYRMVKFVIPLLRGVFLTADELALAMEARCYSENRTDFELSSGINDWTALAAVLLLCILVVIL